MPTIGVAVTVPEPHGSFLRERRSSFGDRQAEGIPSHVTLLPPTVVDDEEYAVLLSHLRAVAAAHRPFTMTLRGTGTFRPTSPVVFVQVSRGIPDCEGIEHDVRRPPLTRALDFPYHPHVTVAQNLDDDGLDRAYEDLADFTASFEVTAIDLYDERDGSWCTRESFPLGG